jgi:hypothetical protein
METAILADADELLKLNNLNGFFENLLMCMKRQGIAKQR